MDEGNLVPRVLVVDDNADGAQALAMLLEIWGHEVRSCHDGASPAGLLKVERPRYPAAGTSMGRHCLRGTSCSRSQTSRRRSPSVPATARRKARAAPGENTARCSKKTTPGLSPTFRSGRRSRC